MKYMGGDEAMKVIFHSGKYLFDDTAPIASFLFFNARD